MKKEIKERIKKDMGRLGIDKVHFVTSIDREQIERESEGGTWSEGFITDVPASLRSEWMASDGRTMIFEVEQAEWLLRYSISYGIAVTKELYVTDSRDIGKIVRYLYTWQPPQDPILKVKDLMEFLEKNRAIAHKCRFHKEAFDTHCYLVIGEAMRLLKKERLSLDGFLAACLHDIAKPRTVATNERGEASFRGHENVSEEEVAMFLDRDYPGFDNVVALIRGHMWPFLLTTRGLDDKLAGSTEGFRRDLLALNRCDGAASIRWYENVSAAIEKAEEVKTFLANW